MFKLRDGFLKASTPLRVAIVGVGGTGSQVVSNLINLHLGLVSLGYAGLQVVAFDPDTISLANIVRQRYAPSDIGAFKATTLISRVNLAYGLDWKAVCERFDSASGRNAWDLVISCVDTRAARKKLHQYAFSASFSQWHYWLDCGNDRTTGQVVLGTPRKRDSTSHRLPCATELHPELMDTSVADDDAPSCSAAEALTKQDLMVNQMAALLAVDLLWRFFRDRQIASHARYFDLETSTVSARRVPEKPKRSRRAA